MARASQAGDPAVAEGGGFRGRLAGAMQGLGSACMQAAVRAGILDFPVHPVRTRRTLAVAAIVYVVAVSGSAGAWWLLMRWFSVVPPVP